MVAVSSASMFDQLSLDRAPPSRPGIAAGLPCHSHPTRRGIASPSFIPVPSKSQCFEFEQTQSASPITGDNVRFPRSSPSSRPQDLNLAISGNPLIAEMARFKSWGLDEGELLGNRTLSPDRAG